MSRIEEEREAARQAERLLQKQRQEEQRQKERAQSEARFAERLSSANAQRARATEDARKHQNQQKQTQTHAADKARRSEDASRTTHQVKESLDEAASRRWLAERVERWKGASEGEAHKTAAVHDRDDHAAADTAQGRSSDDGATSDRGKSRKASADAQVDAASRNADGTAQEKLATDADGKGKGRGGKKDQRDQEMAGQTFRLNPALMAPPPLAKPRETSGSERLRALANEIAQKIVERVRIGTNSAGVAEFQIELRSNVLSGLNIQVSGTKGRISAVFSGRDGKVLKLLREQAESLRSALEGRGLKLQDLRFEERP